MVIGMCLYQVIRLLPADGCTWEDGKTEISVSNQSTARQGCDRKMQIQGIPGGTVSVTLCFHF